MAIIFNPSQPSTMPIEKAAAKFGKTVEAYKAEIVDHWKAETGGAVCGAEGYGYRVVEAKGWLAWNISFSGGERRSISKPVKAIDWSKQYPY